MRGGFSLKKLVGTSHNRLVESLTQRVIRVSGGDHSLSRIVVLEGPSGTGKSRVVRELYRRLRTEFDSDGYWPALDESGSTETRSRDPLPGRKVIGPDTDGFIWPPNALPGFGWWQLHCERMQAGQAIDVTSQARPEIEAHLVPLALAWRRAASVKEKAFGKKDEFTAAARQALYEGGLEAAGQALSAFDIAIPGLGMAASWAVRGYRAVKSRRELKQTVYEEVDLNEDVVERRSSLSREMATLISGVAHPRLPAVVVIEDVHLMSATLGEVLDQLSVFNAAHPVIVVALAWPESREAPVYARWLEDALEQGRAELITMPYLEDSDLAQFVLSYAPNTAPEVATEAVRAYTNPLALEATLGSSVVARAVAANGMALPLHALNAYPLSLEAIYRERFRELPEDIQFALAIAAGAIPETTGLQTWPFIRTIVAEAAERSPAVQLRASHLLENIEITAASGVWLVATGVSDVFREALQAKVAQQYLEQEVLLPAERSSLRGSVVDVLGEWIDSSRDGGLMIEDSDTSLVISRWILELAPHGKELAVLAAAYRVAAELASGYQYRQAIETLDPAMAALSGDPLLSLDRDALGIRAARSHWLARTGRVAEALSEQRELLSDRIRAFGPDDADTLTTQASLGRLLGEAGRVDEAIRELEKLSDHYGRVLGPSASDALITRGLLAYWLADAGRVNEAIAHLQSVLGDQTELLGWSARETLATRSHLASALADSGRWSEALSMLEKLLEDEERTGADVDTRFATRSNRALYLGMLGRTAEAVGEYENLLEESVRFFGPDAPQTLQVRGNLAQTLAKCGQTDEAILRVRALLEDRLRVFGHDAPATLGTRFNLASLLSTAGHWEEAIGTLNKLLPDQQRVLGPDAPDVFLTRGALAQLRADVGQVVDAIADMKALLADQTRVLGPDAPETLVTRRLLAYWLGEAGQVDEAINAIKELLADEERVLGPDSPETLAARNNLAILLGHAGRFSEAVAHSRKVMTDTVRIQGPDSPETLTSRGNLAYFLSGAGQLDEAISEGQSLLRDQQRLLGLNAPATLVTRNNLATVLGRAGRLDEAIAELEMTLADRVSVLGPDAPTTLATRNNLALLLAQGDRLDQAISELERLVEDQVRILGPEAPTTLRARNNLASLLGDAGRVEEAIVSLEALVSDRERILGPDAPDTLQARHNLAHWVGVSGRVGEAIRYYEALLADCERVFGPTAPGTLATRESLGYWRDTEA